VIKVGLKRETKEIEGGGRRRGSRNSLGGHLKYTKSTGKMF
jgi:hypothetical protein